MTPLHFEELYGANWLELEQLLSQLRHGSRKELKTVAGERLAALYRRTCEHLAIARARAYPAYIVDRLEHITAQAHQAIYQRKELGMQRVLELLAYDFPRAVRAQAAYVWLAAAVFVLPLVILGVLVYARPELILSVVDAQQAAEYEEMYSTDAQSIGRLRTAQNDWAMFGYYIRHNVGLAFQCFAGGLMGGIGSLFFLSFNGASIGALAGYLTERGLGPTFYSFVVTHGAFELTAIVLSGAAGLRIGHALIAPGPMSRRQALVLAAKESIVVIYGTALLLFIAAAVEAFWSSAAWIPLPLKYSIAATCWLAVLSYLCLQGRRAS
jgi:uncharacterized membrane protein SpoIIM required for sporulation